jgi:hypothetical protein
MDRIVVTEWPLPVDRLRVLISYHYYRTAKIDELVESLTIQGRRPDVFADSGAFSAWTQGTEVNVDEYAEWLHRWEKYLSVYCNLDVIDDPVGSDRNQRRLELLGLRPLPVWHIRSPRKAWGELLDQYRYVAIGGMVGTPWRKLMPRLVWALRAASDAGVAVHGLGLTSMGPLSRLPFFSVDSSSWGAGFRYGLVSLWSQSEDKMVRVQLGDGKAWAEYADDVRALGFDPARFAKRLADRRETAAVSGLSVGFQEAAIRQRLGVQVCDTSTGHPFTNFPADTGLKVFAAEGSSSNLEAAAAGLRLYSAASQGKTLEHGSLGLKVFLVAGRLGGVVDVQEVAEAMKRETT